MFFGKKQTPEQSKFRSQVITFMLVQGVIFSTLLFVSYLTQFDYGLLLIFAGATLTLILIPSNLELNSYVKTANSMGGHHHQHIFRPNPQDAYRVAR
ncbi:MAG: hypothetical protein Q9P01_06295 [Anaerolineae bacterium]|nr:hypothetical protein [Anaerolineae bacterium]